MSYEGKFDILKPVKINSAMDRALCRLQSNPRRHADFIRRAIAEKIEREQAARSPAFGAALRGEIKALGALGHDALAILKGAHTAAARGLDPKQALTLALNAAAEADAAAA